MSDAADAPPTPIAVDLRDYVDFDLEVPWGRRVFLTDVLACDVVCLEPDQIIEPRTFETADTVYTVLGGRAWVVTDAEEVTLQPLQAVMIPAGTPHGLRNAAADPLIVQAVTSPPDDLPVIPTGPTPEATAEREEAAGRPSLVDRLRRGLGSG